MRTAVHSALGWLMAMLAPAIASAAISVDPNVYIVEEGDTCLGVAAKVWPKDRDGLERLHAFNELGKLPHKLEVGQQLKLASSSPDAKITFLKPDVNVRKAGNIDWLTGQVGQGLFNRDQVSTLMGAAAEVLFKDRSVLQLDQNALVTIYGVLKTTHAPARSGSIELVQGDLRVRLASLRGEAPKTLDVKMPAADVAAKAQHMLVGVDAQKTSRVSVFEGSAKVAANGKNIDLMRGFGTRVEEGAPPEAPLQLPLAPRWLAGGASDVFVALTNEGAPVGIKWSNVDNAEQYKVEVALDTTFNTKISDKTIKKGEPLQLQFPSLGEGQYFARVSAISGDGLMGPPTSTKRLEVKKAIIESGTPTTPGTIRGAVEVRLRLPPEANLRAYVDGQLAEEPVRVRGEGRHKIRIVNAAGAVIADYACDVEPPRVAIGFTPGLKQAVVRFFDSQGKPSSFMEARELGVVGIEGTRVGVLRPQPGGHEWRVDIVPTRAMSSTRVAIVRITWNGKRIGEEMKSEIVQ